MGRGELYASANLERLRVKDGRGYPGLEREG